MSHFPYRRLPDAGLKLWLPPIVVSGLLWWISPNSISAREGVLATVLLILPWYAYGRWQRAGQTRIPMFALLALAYWAAFALPLFLAAPPTNPAGDGFRDATVYEVLMMAVLGVVAMGIGMEVPLRPIHTAAMPDVSDSPGAWRYLYLVMAAGTILASRADWLFVLGNGGHQLMSALANSIPAAICGMLAVRYVEGTATAADRAALGAFVAARIVIGIASGWMGAALFMGVILALVYMSKYRRLPARAILIVIPAVLFLQVGKSAFRSVYWAEGKSGGVFEKAGFWLNASFREWDSVFRNQDREGSHALIAQSLDRIALLPQAANVLEKTPRSVPFQYGASYSYLAATLIPRAVWPDKPSVNDANRFYQVAYGLTTKENLDSVSIAVGCLTESYMNFGWWGVGGVMFLIGLLLGLFERTLLAGDSGLLFCGVGLALVIGLLTIESQAAQYVGGLLQQIAIIFAIALPVVRRRKAAHRQSVHLPSARLA